MVNICVGREGGGKKGGEIFSACELIVGKERSGEFDHNKGR